MARAFSADLRQRVVEAFDSGMSRRAAAGRFEIGISTAINWVRRWRETGNWAARRPGGRVRPPRSEEHTSELQSLMRISYAVFCLKKKKNYELNKQLQLPTTLLYFHTTTR